MEKQFLIKLTQTDLDLLTLLMDVSLKSKGLEVLGQITTLSNHIQAGITELPTEQLSPSI
jgi:cell division protein FtsL